MARPTMVRRQIIWPSPLRSQSAEELLRRLAADDLVVTFEARAERGSVSHYYMTAANTVGVVSRTIESLTDATTIKVDEEAASSEIETTARLTRSGSYLPLLDRAPAASRQLLTALSAAHFDGESLLLRVAVLGSVAPQLMAGRTPDPTQSLPSRVLSGTRPPSGEVAAKMRRKLEEPGVRVLITAGAVAQSESRRRALLSGLLAALRTLQGPGTRLDFVRSDDPVDRPRLLGRLTFTVTEALASAGFPLDEESLPGMPAAHPKQLALKSSNYDATRVFGKTTAPGPERPIGIAVESGLEHIHLLGPTGSGKSTVAEHLIANSIKAGHGLFVIDAKSDLAEDTLRLVPPDRWDDVVVIDPAADGPVVGFNPFDSPGTPPEIIADTILQIVHDLWPDAFGPRTSQATLSGLLTLAGQPDATLTMLPRLFDDRHLRERLLKGNSSIELQAFWDYYDSLSEGAKSQMVGPVRSRLGQFLLRPQLRRALDQPQPTFHLNDLFTKPGRIVVVPLNAGLMGEEASRLAGSLLVSQLQQLTLARLRMPTAARFPVTIVVDEAQAFVRNSGDQLADALSRSRGAGVGWIISHQYRAQMPRDVMAAIDTNTLNKVVFRVQSDDARAVAAMAPELAAEDFMTLPRYGIYASLTHKTTPLGWVSGSTLPPPKWISNADAVRDHSTSKWGSLPPAPEPTRSAGDPPIGRRPRGSA